MPIIFRKQTVFVLFCLLNALLLTAQNGDIRLLRYIHVERNTSLDLGFKVITHSVAPMSLGVPVGLFAVGLLNNDKVSMNNGIEAGASFILASGISYGLKLAVDRPRPYVQYADINNVVQTGPLSFPSGHTTAAFATATSLSLNYPKWYIAVPAYSWACLSAYSRMHLGVHYPSDVLGGMVIGIGSAFLVHHVMQKFELK